MSTETTCETAIALAGNPNVGKSTVFNSLTGLKQHTGNWPGKTVGNARGNYDYDGRQYTLVDLPGTYSLLAHSAEEEIARDYILFGGAMATVVVCDATCLERNLNLALQICELSENVILCVNLLDEARKKGISIDLLQLSQLLGVPVVGCAARSGEGLDELQQVIAKVCSGEIKPQPTGVAYDRALLHAIEPLEHALEDMRLDIVLHSGGKSINPRWLALRLLEQDEGIPRLVKEHLGLDIFDAGALQQAIDNLHDMDISSGELTDRVVSAIVYNGESIARQVMSFPDDDGTDINAVATGVLPHRDASDVNSRDRKLDRLFTSKATGIPIMLALLAGILWLTIAGANYPSQFLSDALFSFQDVLTRFFAWLGTPEWVHGLLVLGMYRVLAWVISVMLPPMAIFFPLFTLLEDFGYLPRVAFNLDSLFKKAKACGKQALTMCMGFGCNSVGVTGCRIIDSPRERLIAIATNSFVPCNGRFPTLIALISMFFVTGGGALGSLLSTLLLLAVILLGVGLTFLSSRLLSATLLKGEPSSFTLELPPYRTPQLGKVLVRSLLDRTMFVLGRAVAVAAPAGLLIWVMANVDLGGQSMLAHCSSLLDPLGHLLGMDGVILMAFILGFPANEIVVPIMIMAYMSTGTIMDLSALSELKSLLMANGWTWLTAVCTLLFCLVHWPCSTTCITIRKETGSWKWTAISVALPTLMGMGLCLIVATVARLLGLA